jgi:hypothetical protein
MSTRRKAWIIAGRILLGFLATLILLALLLKIFCTEENWRGRRALAHCERELRARGEKLDLATFVPPLVPDAENFAMAPLLAPLAKASQQELDRKPKPPGSPLERLDKVSLHPGRRFEPTPGSGDYKMGKPTDLVARQRYLQKDPQQNSAVNQREAARAVLGWLTRWSPELEEFSIAANRPYARFPIDYSKGFAVPVAHLMCLLRFAQVYHLRAIAALEAGDTASALRDLKTLDRMQAAIRSEPLLISYLVRIAIIELLMQAVWECSVEHFWNEDQLREIQAMLARTDLIADYARVVRGERAIGNTMYEKFRASRLGIGSIISEYFSWPETPRQFSIFAFSPNEAVMCQNQASSERWVQDYVLPVMDASAHRIYPARQKEAVRVNDEIKSTPYNVLSKLTARGTDSLPIRAGATQVAIDEAVVACALERFRLRTGQFPNALDALVPDYLPAIPHDVIGGAPLRYRRESDGNYLLYSVGWNEVDDGGVIVPKSAEHPSRDNEKGDWVWPSTEVK